MEMSDYKEIAKTVKKEVEAKTGYTLQLQKYRQVNSGVAYTSTKYFEAPEPTSVDTLATYVHELGHFLPENRQEKLSCMREYLACKFEVDTLKRFGLSNYEVTRDAIWYITYSLAQALNRGMKQIPDELKKYKRYLCTTGTSRFDLYWDYKKGKQYRYFAQISKIPARPKYI